MRSRPFDPVTKDYFFSASRISNSTANSPLMSFYMPRVKLMANQRGDSPLGIVQTFQFAALERVTGAGYPLSSITVQDSAA